MSSYSVTKMLSGFWYQAEFQLSRFSIKGFISGLQLIIPILEILEIEVCNILYNPGIIGKRIFSIQSHPGNIGLYDPYISHVLQKVDRTIQNLLIITCR